MNPDSLHLQRCETCKNEICEYYNYKNIYYGVYDDDANKPLALTPATFTGKKGCASYISEELPENKSHCGGCLAESFINCNKCIDGSECVLYYG